MLSKRHAITFSAAVMLALPAAGCSLGLATVPPPIMSARQQESAILKLAPKGTPRDEVITSLDEAGIHGEFGVSDSIYYCDAWTRNGDVTHLDVALLFDEQGNLYATRPAGASVQAEPLPQTAAEVSVTANEPSDKPGDSQPDRQSAALADWRD